MTARKLWFLGIGISLALVGALVYYSLQPVINRPIVRRTVVHRIVFNVAPTHWNGTVPSVADCQKIPDGMAYGQVVQIYGWPQHAGQDQRGHWAPQETDGWELDYPMGRMHDGFTAFCAVAFGTKNGYVDHKWADL